jgi:CBS-domain-containing membrane protein
MGEKARVRDLMSPKVAILAADDTLGIADEVMCMGRIRHLPVVDMGRVVGVVSQRDLFRSALGTALALGIRQPEELMRTLAVRDVMSTPAVTIGPGAPIQDAARTMAEKKIGCLPVVEDEGLVGILTETDILRYAMRH